MKWKKLVLCLAMIGCVSAAGPLQAFALTIDLNETDEVNETTEATDNSETKTQLQTQIDSYLADLEESQERSQELEDEITSKQMEVGELFVEVASLDIEREAYYQDMKTRIAYFYEEMQGQSILSYLFGADSFADFISRIQFQQSIYSYDAERMAEYQDLVDDIEIKQRTLDAEIEALGDMIEDQVVMQAALDAAISGTQSELDDILAEEAAEEAAELEAAKRAGMDPVEYALSLLPETDEIEPSIPTESSALSDGDLSSQSDISYYYYGGILYSSRWSSSSTDLTDYSSSEMYDLPSGSGVLTKKRGVNYYNGHIETWYSQRVLPGNGLSIPGRHVDSRGIICDVDGYICVASSDYPKGTIVETSLGMAKVYDTGCASGIIDIYTDW